MGRTNRGGIAGGEGEGEEVHSRRRRRQQGGELGDGVADLLRDGLRGVGLERGEEVRLERGLAGGELALLKYPFYPLFILDNGMNSISKSLTV